MSCIYRELDSHSGPILRTSNPREVHQPASVQLHLLLKLADAGVLNVAQSGMQ